MLVMITVFTLILFSTAAGIFIILSAAEWRVLPLVWHSSAKEADIRAVQTMLSLVVRAIPPAMMVILFGSAGLIGVQVFQGSLGAWTWPICLIYLALMGLILTKLFQTIRAVRGVDAATAPLDEVTSLTRDVVIVHHLGLILSVLMVPMFAGVLLQ